MPVTNVTPNIGSTVGGVTAGLRIVQGSGFTGATAVNFDGIPATSVNVLHDGAIECYSPAHNAGVVDVEVVGVGTLAGGYIYDNWLFTNVSVGAGSDNFRDSLYVPGAGFFFVGDNGKIFKSADGSSWSALTGPAPGTQFWKGIGYAPPASGLGSGQGRLCIVGNGGAIATSDDLGASWTARTAPEANQYTSVNWSPTRSKWVAVSSNGTNRVMHSADAITWSAASAAGAATWSVVRWFEGAGLWVALSNGSLATDRVMTSPDEATWTFRTLPRAFVQGGYQFGGGLVVDSALLSGKAYFYAKTAGNDWYFVSSSDGLTWTDNILTFSGEGALGNTERPVEAASRGLIFENVRGSSATTTRTADGFTCVGVDAPFPPLTTQGDFCGVWAEELDLFVCHANGSTDDMMLGLFTADPIPPIPLVLVSVDPVEGSTRGGTPVTLECEGAEDGIIVNFDNIAAEDVIFIDPETVTCLSPPHAEPGLVPVTITNPDGEYSTLADAFEYTEAGIASMTPDHGPMAGGTPVTISGHEFVAGASIFFGGVEATSVVFVDSETYTCVTPPHYAGPVVVNMVFPEGSPAPPPNFQSTFTYDPISGSVWAGRVRTDPEPHISSAQHQPSSLSFNVGHPYDGPVAGQKLQLDLEGGSPAEFDGVAVQTDESFEGKRRQMVTSVTASDPAWLLNAKHPIGSWEDEPADVVVAEMMDGYAPPEFTYTGLQSGLPEVTIVLDGTLSFTDALDAVRKAMGGPGSFYLRGYDLHFFASEVGTDPDPVTDDGPFTIIDPPPTVSEDVTQIRNRVFGKGKGTTTVGVTRAGATSIEVASLQPFEKDGGLAIVHGQIIGYGGVTRVSEAIARRAAPTGGAVSCVPEDGNVRDHVFYKMSFVDAEGVESALGPMLTGGCQQPQIENPSEVLQPADGPIYGDMPTVNSSPGGTLANKDQWAWAFTMVTAVGEFLGGSNTGGHVTTTGGGNNTLTWTLSGDPIDPAITAIRLYREKSTGGGLFRVAQIAPNATSFIDTVADGAMTIPLPTAPSGTDGFIDAFETYVWGYSFYSDSGETQLFPALVLMVTPGPAGGGIYGGQAFSVPISDDARTIGRRIYRTKKDNREVFYRVGEIAQNLTVVNYIDVLNDDSLVNAREDPEVNSTGTIIHVTVPLVPGVSDATPVAGLTVSGAHAAGVSAIAVAAVNDAIFRDGNAIDIGGQTPEDADSFTVVGGPYYVNAGNVGVVVFTPPLEEELFGGEDVAIKPIARKLYRAQANNPSVYSSVMSIPDNSTTEVEDDTETLPPNLLSEPLSPTVRLPRPVSDAPAPLPPVIHYTLTGVSGVLKSIPDDVDINIWIQEDDVDAQIYLGNRTGGDGVRDWPVVDTSLRTAALRDRVLAELTLYSMPIKGVKYYTRDPKTHVGGLVPFNLTSPPIVGSFLIQTVGKNEMEASQAPGFLPRLEVFASSLRFRLEDLLNKALLEDDESGNSRGGGGRSAGASAPPPSPESLTVSSDENVTLTATGAPEIALLADVGLEVGWQGELSTERGGTGSDTSGVTNGQVLVGRTADSRFVAASIAEGPAIQVTEGAGTLEIGVSDLRNAQVAADAAIALSKLAEAVIQADGGQAFTGDQSMGGNKLTNVDDPSAPQDAATKAYVDSAAPSGAILADGSVPFTGDQSMGNNNLEDVADPVADQDAVNKRYVLTHYYEPMTTVYPGASPLQPELIFNSDNEVVVSFVSREEP